MPLKNAANVLFQSAGRIIGWLKRLSVGQAIERSDVSIRRADYWLVEVHFKRRNVYRRRVSIRRADYWLVEVVTLQEVQP